jgi:hypothetical protein
VVDIVTPLLSVVVFWVVMAVLTSVSEGRITFTVRVTIRGHVHRRENLISQIHFDLLLVMR